MMLLLLFFSLLHIQLQAQESTASGTVSDSTGAAIPGASVEVVGTKRGTVTDGSGRFSIRVSPNQQLAITALGYERQVVSAGSQVTVTLFRLRKMP